MHNAWQICLSKGVSRVVALARGVGLGVGGGCGRVYGRTTIRAVEMLWGGGSAGAACSS
jgi:hypothetical protein